MLYNAIIFLIKIKIKGEIYKDNLKMRLRLILLFTGLFFVTNVFSQLGTFNSEVLEKKILRKTIKLPYLEKNNYYGYINDLIN